VKVIGVLSQAGGVGKTTLVSHLAELLAKQGRSVLALEWGPGNMLASHFGAVRPLQDGWLPRFQAGQWWGEAAVVACEGVHVLPAGVMSATGLSAIEAQLVAQPDWLHDNLAALTVGDDTLVLIDTQVWPSVCADQMLRVADFVLVVVTPDPASLIWMGTQRELLERSGKDFAFLVNRFDPARPLQRDILMVLRDRLGARFVPLPIHADETVPASLAKFCSVVQQAPHAQVAHDLEGLTDWLLTRVYPQRGAIR
jgi:cellulose synthase operon protein YhjQ